MRTIVEIKRIRNGRVVERRKFYSRSYVQQFEELLYVQHAQIQGAAARVVYGVNGADYPLDAQAFNSAWNRGYKGNLMVTAPSGGSSIFIPSGTRLTSVDSFGPSHMFTILPGDMIGIQIGTGATAVTPQDKGLVERCAHGGRAVIAGGSRVESYLVGDTSGQDIYGLLATERIAGVAIFPYRQLLVSSIKFLMGRSGNPGQVNLQVQPGMPSNAAGSKLAVTGAVLLATSNTNGNTLPTAAPWEWREFVFGAPFYMYPGIVYLFILSAPAGTSANKALLRYQSTAEATRYTMVSNPTGLNGYLSPGYQAMFDLYGSAAAEAVYGACEVSNLVVANPDASFTIKRLFKNVSGGDISIRECGIHAAGTYYEEVGISVYIKGLAYPLLILRDVVAPPVTWHNNEVLEVSYTPSITV